MPRTVERTAPAHERPSSLVALLSGWVEQGVESFFATQRILIDLALRQNTSAINAIRREVAREQPEEEGEDTPRNILLELAVEGTANYIEAQRVLLDMAQQENELVLKGVSSRLGDYGRAASVTNILRRGVDTFIEMQQNFLTLASRQTQSWLQAPGVGEAKPVHLANDAMKEFVAAQKKFLDAVSEETRNDETHKEHGAKKTPRPELAELGREAADAFIHAQKRLLDLAAHQVNVNTTAVSRAMEMKMPLRMIPVMDIAGEGVKSFVEAEKALVDSMAKSRARHEDVVIEVKPKRAARKPRAGKVRVSKPRASRARAATA